MASSATFSPLVARAAAPRAGSHSADKQKSPTTRTTTIVRSAKVTAAHPRGTARNVRCRASERRASSNENDGDGGKFMGRKGTNRDLVDDDEGTKEARAAVKLDGAFGKPSASKETWEPFQREARAGLLASYVGAEDGGAGSDLVLNSLWIAQEDDAFKSRTAVCLPIDAYVKRVDKLVTEFMQRDYVKLEEAGTVSTTDVIEALEDYLYSQNSYRTPKGWREMYSPYRTYFHNVVAQKVGIPATLAALYIGCVRRLHERGVIPEGVDVLIRPKAEAQAAGVTGRDPALTPHVPVPIHAHSLCLLVSSSARWFARVRALAEAAHVPFAQKCFYSRAAQLGFKDSNSLSATRAVLPD